MGTGSTSAHLPNAGTLTNTSGDNKMTPTRDASVSPCSELAWAPGHGTYIVVAHQSILEQIPLDPPDLCDLFIGRTTPTPPDPSLETALPPLLLDALSRPVRPRDVIPIELGQRLEGSPNVPFPVLLEGRWERPRRRIHVESVEGDLPRRRAQFFVSLHVAKENGAEMGAGGEEGSRSCSTSVANNPSSRVRYPLSASGLLYPSIPLWESPSVLDTYTCQRSNKNETQTFSFPPFA